MPKAVPPLGERIDLLARAGDDVELQLAIVTRHAVEGGSTSVRSVLRLEDKGAPTRVAGELGVSRGTVWRWSTGRAPVPAGRRRALNDLALRMYVTTPATRGARKLQRSSSGGATVAYRGDYDVDSGQSKGRPRVEHRLNKRIFGYVRPDEMRTFAGFARSGDWRLAGDNLGGTHPGSWGAVWRAYFRDQPSLLRYLSPWWTRVESCTIEPG